MKVPNNPSELGIEVKGDKWRDEQKEVIGLITDTDKKFVVLSAPCGSGKTVIAMSVVKMLGLKAFACTSTKQLQEQYIKDFPFAKKLIGRNNFNCLWRDDLTCQDGLFCTIGKECKRIDECPYRIHKSISLNSDVVITNYQYFLAFFNFGIYDEQTYGSIGLIVCDEADIIDGQIRNFYSVALNKKVCEDIVEVNYYNEKYDLDTWLKGTFDVAKEVRTNLINNVQVTLDGKVKLYAYEVKELSRLNTFIRSLSLILSVDLNDWVYDIKDNKMVFKPIFIDSMSDCLFGYSDKYIIMSGVIGNIALYLDKVGVSKDDVAYCKMKSTFDRERRPLIYAPVSRMSYKYRENAIPYIQAAIEKVMSEHPKERIVVHCTSYWLLNEIYDGIESNGRNKVFHTDASGIESALEQHRCEEGSILFSPSLSRGVDFKYDDARVQMILRLPFASLADKQIMALKERDGRQYIQMAVNDLQQMYGRGMRAEDDSCITYILDANFPWLYDKYRYMFEDWVREAIAVEKDKFQQAVIEDGVD